MTHEPLETVVCGSLREAITEILPRKRPVKLAGLARAWPAVTRWTPAWFRERFASEVVKVYESPDGRFPGEYRATPDGSSKTDDGRRTLMLSGAELVDRMTDPSRPPCYLHAHPLPEDLVADIDPAAWPEEGVQRFLWISAPGHITPAHFDGSDNLFVQIHGTKRVEVFPPERFAQMALHGSDHRYARHTQLDAPAGGLATDVEPGDVVYIPQFWFHHVTTRTLSISMNAWWTEELFPDFDAIMTDWVELRARMAAALPQLPERYRTYFLRVFLFSDLE